MWWETERSESNVLVNDQKPEMKLRRDYVRNYNSGTDELHNLNAKMTAERSPSKMLNINKTNKSTLQAKHRPWSWIWERKQVRGRGEPEGRWIRSFVNGSQKVNRENDRSLPSPPSLPRTVYWGSLPVQIRSIHAKRLHLLYVCVPTCRFFKYVWVWTLHSFFWP